MSEAEGKKISPHPIHDKSFLISPRMHMVAGLTARLSLYSNFQHGSLECVVFSSKNVRSRFKILVSLCVRHI